MLEDLSVCLQIEELSVKVTNLQHLLHFLEMFVANLQFDAYIYYNFQKCIESMQSEDVSVL